MPGQENHDRLQAVHVQPGPAWPVLRELVHVLEGEIDKLGNVLIRVVELPWLGHVNTWGFGVVHNRHRDCTLTPWQSTSCKDFH